MTYIKAIFQRARLLNWFLLFCTGEPKCVVINLERRQFNGTLDLIAKTRFFPIKKLHTYLDEIKVLIKKYVLILLYSGASSGFQPNQSKNTKF